MGGGASCLQFQLDKESEIRFDQQTKTENQEQEVKQKAEENPPQTQTPSPNISNQNIAQKKIEQEQQKQQKIEKYIGTIQARFIEEQKKQQQQTKVDEDLRLQMELDEKNQQEETRRNEEIKRQEKLKQEELARQRQIEEQKEKEKLIQEEIRKQQELQKQEQLRQEQKRLSDLQKQKELEEEMERKRLEELRLAEIKKQKELEDEMERKRLDELRLAEIEKQKKIEDEIQRKRLEELRLAEIEKQKQLEEMERKRLEQLRLAEIEKIKQEEQRQLELRQQEELRQKQEQEKQKELAEKQRLKELEDLQKEELRKKQLWEKQEKERKEQELRCIERLKETENLVLAEQVQMYVPLPPEENITEAIMSNKIVKDNPQVQPNQVLGMQLLLTAGKSSNMNIQFTSNDSKSNIASSSMLTGDISDSLKLQLHFEEGNNGQFGDLQYDKINESEQSRLEFEKNMKIKFAEMLKVQPEDVHIITCVRGSVQVEVIVNSVNKENLNNDKITLNVKEGVEKYAGKKVDVSVQEPTYLLCVNDFDKAGDIEFQKGLPQKLIRGKRDYFQPQFPWKRLGLNVKDKFDNGNKDWIGMNGNPNEWAVAFHGFGKTAEVLPKIIKEQFREGQRQLHQKDVGRGVYCTPHIEVAEGYAGTIELDGKKYKMLMQCRVKPEKIKECPGNTKYWVLNDPKHIRPYGICLRQVE